MFLHIYVLYFTNQCLRETVPGYFGTMLPNVATFKDSSVAEEGYCRLFKNLSIFRVVTSTFVVISEIYFTPMKYMASFVLNFIITDNGIWFTEEKKKDFRKRYNSLIYSNSGQSTRYSQFGDL